VGVLVEFEDVDDNGFENLKTRPPFFVLVVSED
jgi:hypothetical protein